MKEKRTTALMAILLVVIGIALVRPYVEDYFNRQPPVAAGGPPRVVLPGEIRIDRVEIVTDKQGRPTARVSYFYNGAVAARAMIAARAQAGSKAVTTTYNPKWVEPGAGVIELEVQRPSLPREAHLTRQVEVWIGDDKKPAIAQTVEHVIEWPDQGTYYARLERSRQTPDFLYKKAVEMIDSNDANAVVEARRNLEQVLLADPGHLPSQIELARVAMKTNWGTEGLAQAEKYLLAVKAVDKDNANAKVLLGYVYTHQSRHAEAEREFGEVAAIGTRNLWLWANWGELLLKQNKEEAALDKYRQAVAGERPFDTYDRARLDAYRNLFEILERRKRLDELDVLYKRRADEFSTQPCMRAEYAGFRMWSMADADGAIALMKTAIEAGCTSPDATSTLGAAYYLAWANLQGAEKAQAYSQAQVFLPEGPIRYYLLARSNATAKVIGSLVAAGNPLGVRDNQKFNALSIALGADDIDAARRLIRLGLKPGETVGEEKYPVALIPVMRQSVRGVELMQQNGVDFTKLRWNGMSALEMARRTQNAALIKALEKGSSREVT